MKLGVDYFIKKVTVYPDRARVTCQGKVAVNEDVSALQFDELPLSIDPDSLRVKGEGTAKIRILGLEARIQQYEQTPSEKSKELENQLEQLKFDLLALEDQYNVWNAQLEHLNGLRLATGEYAKGLSRGKSSVEDQLRLIQFLRERDEEFRGEQRNIIQKKQVLERQKSKVERELADLRSTRPLQRYQVLVNVEVLQAGEFWPEMDYVVGNAAWKPVYDVRLIKEPSGSEIEIKFMAQIAQKTGQDWDKIQLSISTSRPALNKQLPELTPWYIDEMRPFRFRKDIAVGALSMEPVAAAMPAAVPQENFDVVEERMNKAEIVQSKMNTSDSSISFDAPGIWDIPSDGSPFKSALLTFSLEPDINYLTIPRYANAVYRRAKIVNTSGAPLLDGEASLFAEDQFIGSTQIKHTPVDGELELLMGVEEQIIVKRELTKRAVDKRMLRENRIQRYAYKVELKNLLNSRVKLEIQDQIPVARHEQIKVKLDNSTPEPNEKDDLNILTWHLDLDSGRDFTIAYEFWVEYPAAMNVIGL